MLPDSMNVGVIADNIRSLQGQVVNIEATVGTIPVGKIPKDYSTNETDTGVKWVDGKNIYKKTFEFVTPEISTTSEVGSIDNLDKVISYDMIVNQANGNFIYYPNYCYISVSGAGKVNVTTGSLTAYAGINAWTTIYYTKQSPTRDESKLTKKKTSKKGEQNS